MRTIDSVVPLSVLIWPFNRPGQFAQDIFGLRTLYLEGRKAPSAHLHWRRFAIKDVPYKDPTAFEKWLFDRWLEKEKLLKQFQQEGRFPSENAHIQVKIAVSRPLQFLQIAASIFAVLPFCWIFKFAYGMIVRSSKPKQIDRLGN